MKVKVPFLNKLFVDVCRVFFGYSRARTSFSNKNLRFYFINCGVIIPILLFSACHRPRQKTAAAPAADSLTAVVAKDTVTLSRKDSTAVIAPTPEPEEPKVNVNVETVDFKYLTARSKISFKSKDQDIDNANVNIRMLKDSVLWLSIVAGPIEVVRGLITRDSIQIVDRYHKEYYLYDFNTLSQKFNFQLNFELIQSILIGNMPIPKKENQRFKKEKDYFMLRQQEGKIMLENYIGEQNHRLKKLLVTEQPTKNSLTLNYDDFTQLNNYLFPYTSLIQLDYQSQKDNQLYQTVFRIKHQKVELSEKPVNFPFSIPQKYERK
ncbi:DUF4292 domain-containing protein [Runella slithyformis]|uniref:DUF4292 domain-containing protein n=1 Tax=Runella slithyformis (strain ATCC 29530 / DSM 19594 / LMG 11500 / NCIMB 11436 / LSU 4) TaxID=761193 RepID=A0A7U4E4A9_RUNSL|nr:DUF4292 domain-containing protein [Runella slithyformis]AEI47253.1 hypothetical protein Runsl_0815 [Runella slithyformis DSM 19594]